MAVHVGVRGPGHLSRTFGWSPAQLGSSLLGWWDAENAGSLSLSGTSVTTWTDLVGSYAATQGISGSKPRYDANAFGGVLNKCTNTNVNPANLTNVGSGGDAAAVFSVVDDSAALAALGLTGNVVKIDNTLGTTPAWAVPGGTPGNTNNHTFSTYIRGGTGSLRFNTGGNVVTFGASASYVRRINADCPVSASGNTFQIRADAGQVVYFILNGLYEGAAAPAQDVVVNGAAAYGFGRPGLIFDGADDELTYAGIGAFPIGAADCEMWALADQTALAADTSTRTVFAYGDEASNAGRKIQRVVSSGNNPAIRIGNGTSAIQLISTGLDYSGRHLLRGIVSPTASQADLDGVAGTSGAVTPATGSLRTRIGARASTAAEFFQGTINTVIVTAPLAAAQAAQLTAYLKTRGGIA